MTCSESNRRGSQHKQGRGRPRRRDGSDDKPRWQPDGDTRMVPRRAELRRPRWQPADEGGGDGRTRMSGQRAMTGRREDEPAETGAATGGARSRQGRTPRRAADRAATAAGERAATAANRGGKGGLEQGERRRRWGGANLL